MSWNNQGGGGPWKSPGQGPWGQGSGGNTPPNDIEEAIRRLQKGLGGLTPGGMGGFGVGGVIAQPGLLRHVKPLPVALPPQRVLARRRRAHAPTRAQSRTPPCRRAQTHVGCGCGEDASKLQRPSRETAAGRHALGSGI